MALNIDTLYAAAMQEKQEMHFNDAATARRVRLRIYNYRRSHEELPRLTIILRDSTLFIGPEGWDLLELVTDASPKTLEAMDRIEQEQMAALTKQWEQTQRAREKSLPNPAEYHKAMFGAPKEKGTKLSDESNVPFDPYAAEENATKPQSEDS